MVETVHQEENPIRDADKESIDRLFQKTLSSSRMQISQ